jgi:hypothetical protein
MKSTKPNVAVVYATASGEMAYFDGRPLRWTEAFYTKYRRRYDVDTGKHRRTVELRSSPLPARGDIYAFEATVDLGFRVTDPVAVVRANVTDALAVVYGYLGNRLRPVTRQFDIEQAAAAEDAINAMFARPVNLPDGITIFECNARLRPDAAARLHQDAKVTAARTFDRRTVEHVTDLQGAQHQGEIDALQQAGRLAMQGRELAAMGNRPIDARKLVMLHLAKHPGDTQTALQLLMQHEQAVLERRDLLDQRSVDMLKYLADRDLIQPGDIDVLRAASSARPQPWPSARRATATTPFSRCATPGIWWASWPGWTVPAGPPR